MNLNNSLIEAIEQNHLGHFAYLPKILGFDVRQINGITAINCGLKTSMFNIAYGLSNDFNSVIKKIIKFYKGQSFAWWIPPSQHNSDASKIFIENGFVIETTEHAMICDLRNPIHFVPKTGLIIKVVTIASLLKDFISVLEPYDPCVSLFYERMNDELLNKNEKLVVGYKCGQPVSIGILFVFQKSAGIFSLVTSEYEQGLGYGTDMMLFLMKLARDHGCGSVTLSASSDAGYRIYERLSFSKVGEFECFEYRA